MPWIFFSGQWQKSRVTNCQFCRLHFLIWKQTQMTSSSHENLVSFNGNFRSCCTAGSLLPCYFREWSWVPEICWPISGCRTSEAVRTRFLAKCPLITWDNVRGWSKCMPSLKPIQWAWDFRHHLETVDHPQGEYFAKWVAEFWSGTASCVLLCTQRLKAHSKICLYYSKSGLKHGLLHSARTFQKKELKLNLSRASCNVLIPSHQRHHREMLGQVKIAEEPNWTQPWTHREMWLGFWC